MRAAHPAILVLAAAALFCIAPANGQTVPAPKNPSGNEPAPNYANYNESAANVFPDYPEVLTLADGGLVTTPEVLWNRRQPEIVSAFEREALGRVPPNRQVSPGP
jgi:hypothetical protein